MTYSETLEYLYTAAPAFEKVGAGAYKEGLSTTRALDEHFGHPHTLYHTIHVAGTNGKGSVSHTLAALLQAAGHRVGLYTSPHLADFAERIRVNGQPISHEYVVGFVEKERSFFEPLSPSFFEITTALAFKYFADQKVDVAVIEVGLGGRLDCTNIITPLLSVITNISFDHTALLGNTQAKIHSEKAGIIKPGVPVVIGEATDETRPVFESKASEVGAPIIFAEDCQQVISSRQTVSPPGRLYHTVNWGTLQGTLGGACQERNVNTVLATLLPLARAMKRADMRLCPRGGVTPMKALCLALKEVTTMTGLMGRWQKLSSSPLTICDTGHNLAAWQLLAPQIIATAQSATNLRIVFGMVDDKDLDSVLQLLPATLPLPSKNVQKENVSITAKSTPVHYYFCQAQTHRAIPRAELTKKASEYGLTGRSFASVAEAYCAALADASTTDFIFVGGSSYVVADLLLKCKV